MQDRSRLIKMRIQNIGCIGPNGLTIDIDNILCLVGANNSGKSTVLRAYELAVGSEKFTSETDLSLQAGDLPATVEIWVHIPKGTENVAEKWKVVEQDLLLVRSKWEWNKNTAWSKVRTTWDPDAGEYSLDDKASGLDAVFNSRLPIPFRIGSLDDPKLEHQKLLTLVLQPVADRITKLLADDKSELKKAISSVSQYAQLPVSEERERLNQLKGDLNKSHNEIFPDLSIDFNIDIGQIEINPITLLLKNSSLQFTEWESRVKWSQQGTGSQRALFWTMLQVRSKLKAVADMAEKQTKAIDDERKAIDKLQKEADKAKKEDTKLAKAEEIKHHEAKIAELSKLDSTKSETIQETGLSLPGFMLLIDEPEVGLHPNAIRSASRYLYNLAEDPAWQIMLATHSPVFLDPMNDHTTIVRLDRSAKQPTPLIYRSNTPNFDATEKDALKMLNRFELSLAEMFFGQYPVIVEGDTEFAVFEAVIARHIDQFPASKKPIIIRARGKYTTLLIMRILKEFKVPFSILHDSDFPLRSDGSKNGAWTANSKIAELAQQIRSAGSRVVHRVSAPNFEFTYFPMYKASDGSPIAISSEDKPWNAYDLVKTNSAFEFMVMELLKDLLDPNSAESQYTDGFEKGLVQHLYNWADANGITDPRLGR
ncbi:MAG: AAA family ATPase [Bacteroidota bacterium]